MLPPSKYPKLVSTTVVSELTTVDPVADRDKPSVAKVSQSLPEDQQGRIRIRIKQDLLRPHGPKKKPISMSELARRLGMKTGTLNAYANGRSFGYSVRDVIADYAGEGHEEFAAKLPPALANLLRDKSKRRQWSEPAIGGVFRYFCELKWADAASKTEDEWLTMLGDLDRAIAPYLRGIANKKP